MNRPSNIPPLPIAHLRLDEINWFAVVALAVWVAVGFIAFKEGLEL